MSNPVDILSSKDKEQIKDFARGDKSATQTSSKNHPAASEVR